MILRRLILLSFVSFAGIAKPLPLEKLSLPTGYSIEIYASDVKNARQMALSDNGILFVGSRDSGLLTAVVDKDQDGNVDEVLQIAKDLTMPSGLTIKDGDLYVAEVSRILKYANIEQNFRELPEPEVVIDGLPDKKHHGWKNIDFGPDDWLYVPVGAPCNICETNGGDKFDNPEFASILKYNLKTKERVWVAKGVRNSVGFDWHPQTNK